MDLQTVDVGALAPVRLESLIGDDRATAFRRTVDSARTTLAGRAVINVNSTAVGGGVAELLQTLLALARGVGIDARWLVVRGTPAFFAITKRLHHHLYGARGDGGRLGPAERTLYEATLADNVSGLLAHVRPQDFVLLHDPQTAGLVSAVQSTGATAVWRCHVGVDEQNEQSVAGWSFLRPYIEQADAFVFSRREFVPAWIPRERLAIIPPSIDPFSAKNEAMEPAGLRRVLRYVGLLEGDGAAPLATFTSREGAHATIVRRAELLGTGPPPPSDAPLVVQVSRWDPQKDMRGVMTCFAEHLASSGAHLILAGPAAGAVADDPEADLVLRDCLTAWQRLGRRHRRQIHLANLPMVDAGENAAIVNALQRHATVVVQKSLAEGFGLTVAEAMWKARPVVGSPVGGINDQIVSGETGWLLRSPVDLEDCAERVGGLLSDLAEADRLGANGRQRILERFLGDRHLTQWAGLFAGLARER